MDHPDGFFLYTTGAGLDESYGRLIAQAVADDFLMSYGLDCTIHQQGLEWIVAAKHANQFNLPVLQQAAKDFGRGFYYGSKSPNDPRKSKPEMGKSGDRLELLLIVSRMAIEALRIEGSPKANLFWLECKSCTGKSETSDTKEAAELLVVKHALLCPAELAMAFIAEHAELAKQADQEALSGNSPTAQKIQQQVIQWEAQRGITLTS